MVKKCVFWVTYYQNGKSLKYFLNFRFFSNCIKAFRIGESTTVVQESRSRVHWIALRNSYLVIAWHWRDVTKFQTICVKYDSMLNSSSLTNSLYSWAKGNVNKISDFQDAHLEGTREAFSRRRSLADDNFV